MPEEEKDGRRVEFSVWGCPPLTGPDGPKVRLRPRMKFYDESEARALSSHAINNGWEQLELRFREVVTTYGEWEKWD
jgi:hypothetical protein